MSEKIALSQRTLVNGMIVLAVLLLVVNFAAPRPPRTQAAPAPIAAVAPDPARHEAQDRHAEDAQADAASARNPSRSVLIPTSLDTSRGRR